MSSSIRYRISKCVIGRILLFPNSHQCPPRRTDPVPERLRRVLCFNCIFRSTTPYDFCHDQPTGASRAVFAAHHIDAWCTRSCTVTAGLLCAKLNRTHLFLLCNLGDGRRRKSMLTDGRHKVSRDGRHKVSRGGMQRDRTEYAGHQRCVHAACSHPSSTKLSCLDKASPGSLHVF